MKRFDFDADSLDEVRNYFRNRAIQLLVENYVWSGEVSPLINDDGIWGAKTTYHAGAETYYSVYVLKSFRGKGFASAYFSALKRLENSALFLPGQQHNFITTNPCKVYEFLSKYVNTKLAGSHLDWPQYQEIEKFYGDGKARRSGLYLMNHIDEGAAILRHLGSDDVTLKAYMLHPMVQDDGNLPKTYRKLSVMANSSVPDPILTTESVMFAMEYRYIANSFLSPMENHPGYEDAEKIKLSPIPEINEMLVADKVQNYKDFLVHHADSHPRADWLDKYFKQWLTRLGISMSEFNRLKSLITVP